MDVLEALLASFPDQKGYKAVRDSRFQFGLCGSRILGLSCLDIAKELTGLQNIHIESCNSPLPMEMLEDSEWLAKNLHVAVTCFRLPDMLELRNLKSITFIVSYRNRPTWEHWKRFHNVLVNWLKEQFEIMPPGLLLFFYHDSILF